MKNNNMSLRNLISSKLLVTPVALLVVFSLILAPSATYAQVLNMPLPGSMVHLSGTYNPVLIKGLSFDTKNPLEFNFIVDAGDSEASIDQLKQETQKMVKYFLTAMTVPEQNIWVNLSPSDWVRC